MSLKRPQPSVSEKNIPKSRLSIDRLRSTIEPLDKVRKNRVINNVAEFGLYGITRLLPFFDKEAVVKGQNVGWVSVA
ncbi:MAG: hypothetical protein CTY19_02795 [Methylomonas sp.]|nr:MAG: hypothetical protein CTY19_02795 [Methylomonas sp.]